MKYSKILSTAKDVQKNVKKDYKTKVHNRWCYYFADAIVNKRKDVTDIKINDSPNPVNVTISRQIGKSDYIDICKRLVKYTKEHNRLPNYVTYKTFKIEPHLLVEFLSRILISYEVNGKLPTEANINSKVFTKPTEYPNKVYGLWVKHIKTKPKCLDDVCDYVKAHFKYLFYNDDVRSNEQVLIDEAGNCTDLLQMLTNMADAMDYDWEVYHVMCNVSGVGHVYGKFRKKGTNNWFIRDIACIADESRYCVWCEAGNGGTLRAKNPNWFLQNRNR